MNNKFRVSLNTEYHLELIDSCTGKVKQDGTFHNLITNSAGHALAGINTSSMNYASKGNWRLPTQIRVGKGTAEPKVTDTSLGSALWSADASLSKFEWIGDNAARVIATATFPATSSYVGNVTEVALYSCSAIYDYGYKYTQGPTMSTHALLTDSEGQPISFNKTDLDILKVTVVVELYLENVNADFTMFKHTHYVHNRLSPNANVGTGGIVDDYGYLHLFRFGHTIAGRNVISSSNSMTQLGNELEIRTGFSSSASTFDVANRTAYQTTAVTRVGTDNITSERYFDSIVFPLLGFWQLPNENVFPAYSIKGISIGIGDGVKTQFLNPLSYFKADTDKVYKNGVLLTRGVDYSISSHSNVNGLPELCYRMQPNKVHSARNHASGISDVIPFFKIGQFNLIKTNSNNINRNTEACHFSSAYPLYFEYDEPTTLNSFKCTGGLFRLYQSGNTTNIGSLNTGTKFYLDCSEDGATYTNVCEIITTGTAGRVSIDFADTTAKYWRLRVDDASVSSSYSVMYYSNNGNEDGYVFLYKKEPYITFTEAPAEGDILTMEVDMDLIMKNSNFVLDISSRIDFSW